MPSQVRADRDRFVLVEGLQRLEAMKALGESTVRSLGGIAFCPVLRWIDMAARSCGALDQGGIDDH